MEHLFFPALRTPLKPTSSCSVPLVDCGCVHFCPPLFTQDTLSTFFAGPINRQCSFSLAVHGFPRPQPCPRLYSAFCKTLGPPALTLLGTAESNSSCSDSDSAPPAVFGAKPAITEGLGAVVGGAPFVLLFMTCTVTYPIHRREGEQ